jgi:putative addiction module component (TIGR02574 family)
MSAITEVLKDRFSHLDVDERAELAAYLIRTLDDETDEAGVEAAWEAELARRSSEIERSEVEGIPAEELFAKLRRP